MPVSTTSNTATPTVEKLWSEERLQEAIKLYKVSPQNEQKLRVLKVKLQNVDHSWNDPQVVLAYAEEYGFEEAEQRFRKMIAWRKQNKVDSLLEEYQPHPLLWDNSPVAFLKDYDRDGDPIYLERGGACDANGLLKIFSAEEIMRHSIWLREVQSCGGWLDEYEQRQGRPVKDITLVYDMEGLSYGHLNPNVLSFYGQVMKMTEDYYPGPVKRVIIIRAPYIFSAVWAVAKHFFSEEMRKSMIFAGSDYLSELSKYMDLDVLPPCINPKGKGETAIGMPKRMEGGPIPSYVGPGGKGYTPLSKYVVEELSETETCSSSSEDEDEEMESPCKTTMTAMGALGQSFAVVTP
jgi:CRAL/TRIO domain